MSVINVIKDGFCVGCGNCTHVAKDNFIVSESSFAVVRSASMAESTIKLSSSVCPFSGESDDEDVIGARYYNSAPFHEKNVGYYHGVYVGHDRDAERRSKSSSGGLATLLVSELLDRGMVDAAIVVAYDQDSVSGVSYQIVESISGLESSRQSKYVLAGYAHLLDEIESSNKRYVFVGIPCHIKAIRLLAKVRSNISLNIKYHIAVFCGHQKTTAFRDYISWQLGVKPTRLRNLVYRVKKPGYKAHEYFYRAIDVGGREHESEVSTLKWMDWGLGLFKLRACDYCDDVAGEAADVIFGDAWLKPYTSDYLGNNLVITRNEKIDQLMIELAAKEAIELKSHDLSAVFQAQGANFRHRKEGLLSRISELERLGKWHPKKRSSLATNFSINDSRHVLYLRRELVSESSHGAFQHAVEKNKLDVFYAEMKPCISLYEGEYTKNIPLKLKIKALIKKVLKRISLV